MGNPNKIFIRKDKPAFQILVLSFFAQLAGIFMMISSLWVWWQIVIGVILLLIGLFGISLKSEMIFDAARNSLDITWSALGLQKTQNKTLPEIDYIAIVRIKTSKELNILSISYKDERSKCNLNLIFKDSKIRYKKLHTLDKKEAFIMAEKLASKLDKPILDHSTTNKVWIKAPLPT